MSETPFFFLNGTYRLFGVLHEANGKPKKEGFVFCAPFAEEKLWAHRVMVNYARTLADSGYAVLRFDYMGNGDSEGDFEECTITTMLSDTECAINKFKNRVQGLEAINLLGLRFGATIASIYADEKPDVNNLILWEPIVNGLSYMREMLRINLTTQSAIYKEIRHNTEALVQLLKDGSTVNVDGYEITWPLYAQIASIDLLNRQHNFESRVLITQISRKEGVVSPAFGKLKTMYSRGETALSVEEPFWKEIRQYYPMAENLFTTTTNWLNDDK
jgi:exosortase A-associated hydrolase 2